MEHQPYSTLNDAVHALVMHLYTTFSLPDIQGTHEKDYHLKRTPSMGAGVYSSDIGLRLYHRTKAIRIKPMSCDEFVLLCVTKLRERIHSGPVHLFACIVDVTLPTEDAIAQNIHRDRILFYTREFAKLRAMDPTNIITSTLEMQLPVLHHDQAFVIINKPANMLSVPGIQPTTTSVHQLVCQYYAHARMVHRLDYETSGVLVVALTRTTAEHLNAQFRRRTVRKRYLARVYGHVKTLCGRVSVRMARDSTQRLVQHVVSPHDEVCGIANTITDWNVHSHSQPSENITSTLMELWPLTGKTHQLRVHMEYLGHPILGDSIYSPRLVNGLAPRLLLHATSIEFIHPITNQNFSIQASCPFD